MKLRLNIPFFTIAFLLYRVISKIESPYDILAIAFFLIADAQWHRIK